MHLTLVVRPDLGLGGARSPRRPRTPWPPRWRTSTHAAAELMDRIRLIGMDQPARVAPAIGRARQSLPLAIQEAITARNVLLPGYRDRLGVATAREVEPVAFVRTRARWYLMAGPRSTPPETP